MGATKVKFTTEQIEDKVSEQVSYSEEYFDIYLSKDVTVSINNGYTNAIMDFELSVWDDVTNAWRSGPRVRVAKQGDLIEDVCYGIERVLDKGGILEW